MHTFLGWCEAAATQGPRAVIAVLGAVTLAMAALASTLEVEVDLTQFGRGDSQAVQAMDRVREEFGDPTAAIQVILDAGPGGDILTSSGLAMARGAADLTLEALGPDVRTDEEGRPILLSLGSAVSAAMTERGLDPATVDDARVGEIAARVVASNPQLAGLVSDDLSLGEGAARATVIVALLDPGLTESERTDAGERVRAAFDGRQEDVLADARVTVFSSGLFASGMLDAIRAEAPLLFGLALLVVLAILALTYRSLFDVAVGFVGLVTTVVWTFGLAAVLGPAYLGWTGPLSQLAVIIPVLLVGLGIDYSVHLTARYREQRAAGQQPAAAAGRALHTVGAALVLAAGATAVGFASLAIAPLQMIADFGVFVAVGVVCAFVIMTLLVPAARVWHDRHQAGRRLRSGKGADEPAAVRELGLAWLMRMPVWLARRAPAVGLLVAALLTVASLLAATGLETEFDRDDFIPEGSDIEAVLAHQEELFGGGVTESTFVVIDGDLTDPTVANAVWDAQSRVGNIEGVRRVGDTPQVLSVVSLVAAALDPAGDPRLGGPAGETPGTSGDGGPLPEREASVHSAPVDAWTGDGFAEDADLPAVYAFLRRSVGEQRVDQLLTPDSQAAVVHIRTTEGDAGAERLQREVEAAFAPVERAGAAVAVTSEPIIIGEMSEDLSRFQAQAIGLTLAIVLALLTAYYALAHRRPLLGMIAMIPPVVSASLIVGTMWLLGISFNAMTATITAIAIGIGVDYGVHVVHRFMEDLEDAAVADAVARTLGGTGAALTGSALTTLGAFVVLSFSGLPPIRSLGLLGGAGIAFALLAGILAAPGALVLWARRRAPRDGSHSHPVPSDAQTSR